jgi:hypothetical protein
MLQTGAARLGEAIRHRSTSWTGHADAVGDVGGPGVEAFVP